MKCLLLLALVPLSCCADVIYLSNGRQLEGAVEGELNGVVSILVRQGTVRVPRGEIVAIERANTPVVEFQRRFEELQQRGNASAADWLKLATYAEANRMHNDATQAYVAALQIDPNNKKARTALGYTYFDNTWMTQREYARATGLIRHNNAWTTGPHVSEIRDLNAQTQALNVSADTAASDATALEDRAQNLDALRRSRRRVPYTPYTREAAGYTRQSRWYKRQQPIYTGEYSTVLSNY